MDLGIDETRDLYYLLTSIIGLIFVTRLFFFFFSLIEPVKYEIIKAKLSDKEAIATFKKNIEFFNLQYIPIKKKLIAYFKMNELWEYESQKRNRYKEIQKKMVKIINHQKMKYELQSGGIIRGIPIYGNGIIFKEEPITESQKQIVKFVEAARTICYNRKTLKRMLILFIVHFLDLILVPSFILMMIPISFYSILAAILSIIISLVIIIWTIKIGIKHERLKLLATAIMGGYIESAQELAEWFNMMSDLL